MSMRKGCSNRLIRPVLSNNDPGFGWVVYFVSGSDGDVTQVMTLQNQLSLIFTYAYYYYDTYDTIIKDKVSIEIEGMVFYRRCSYQTYLSSVILSLINSPTYHVPQNSIN
jgi:hypothetical protein